MFFSLSKLVKSVRRAGKADSAPSAPIDAPSPAAGPLSPKVKAVAFKYPKGFGRAFSRRSSTPPAPAAVYHPTPAHEPFFVGPAEPVAETVFGPVIPRSKPCTAVSIAVDGAIHTLQRADVKAVMDATRDDGCIALRPRTEHGLVVIDMTPSGSIDLTKIEEEDEGVAWPPRGSRKRAAAPAATAAPSPKRARTAAYTPADADAALLFATDDSDSDDDEDDMVDVTPNPNPSPFTPVFGKSSFDPSAIRAWNAHTLAQRAAGSDPNPPPSPPALPPPPRARPAAPAAPAPTALPMVFSAPAMLRPSGEQLSRIHDHIQCGVETMSLQNLRTRARQLINYPATTAERVAAERVYAFVNALEDLSPTQDDTAEPAAGPSLLPSPDFPSLLTRPRTVLDLATLPSSSTLFTAPLPALTSTRGPLRRSGSSSRLLATDGFTGPRARNAALFAPAARWVDLLFSARNTAGFLGRAHPRADRALRRVAGPPSGALPPTVRVPNLSRSPKRSTVLQRQSWPESAAERRARRAGARRLFSERSAGTVVAGGDDDDDVFAPRASPSASTSPARVAVPAVADKRPVPPPPQNPLEVVPRYGPLGAPVSRRRDARNDLNLLGVPLHTLGHAQFAFASAFGASGDVRARAADDWALRWSALREVYALCERFVDGYRVLCVAPHALVAVGAKRTRMHDDEDDSAIAGPRTKKARLGMPVSMAMDFADVCRTAHAAPAPAPAQVKVKREPDADGAAAAPLLSAPVQVKLEDADELVLRRPAKRVRFADEEDGLLVVPEPRAPSPVSSSSSMSSSVASMLYSGLIEAGSRLLFSASTSSTSSYASSYASAPEPTPGPFDEDDFDLDDDDDDVATELASLADDARARADEWDTPADVLARARAALCDSPALAPGHRRRAYLAFGAHISPAPAPAPLPRDLALLGDHPLRLRRVERLRGVLGAPSKLRMSVVVC